MLILGIETATQQVSVAIGGHEGVLGMFEVSRGRRHAETLTPAIEFLCRQTDIEIAEFGAIAVDVGPGLFTGMRVGIATAKALAHGLGIPIAGIATAEALLAAADSGAGEQAVLLLPAGPSDRVFVVAGKAILVKGGEEPEIPEGAALVAVDLPDRAPAEALALGAQAEERLSAALLRLGALRLAAGGDDVARLVPEYVTLPRGIAVVKGEVRWSHDRT